MGTSLTVHPFAALAGMVPDSCLRVLINLDQVGDFGTRSDDVICLGKTDDVVCDLCKELGWKEELDAAWKETEKSVIDFNTDDSIAPQKRSAEDEVEAITEAVGKTLHIQDTPSGAEETRLDEANQESFELEGKAASSFQVEVNHAGSTKPKATYIIGGVEERSEKTERKNQSEIDDKVADQKL